MLALAPEHRLTLEAARVDGRDSDLRLAAMLRSGVDWERLRETAARHGVFPVLHARLAALRALVPPGAAARMSETFAGHARRNLLATAQLLKALKALESRGIPAIPIKGPALAEAAYGDVAMRQFSDLDILVREGDIGAVKELLVAHGYGTLRPMTARQETAHLRRTCELTFTLPGTVLSLDVHFRLAADYLAPAVDASAVFARHGQGRLQGHPVRALDPDDLLLFLCLHGTFHLWETLGLVSDVARLLQGRVDRDWPLLLERARGFRLRRMLLLGVWLARELLGAAVPADVAAEAAGDPAVRELAEKARRDLFREDRQAPGLRETALFQLSARDGLADRLSYCAIRAFSPTVRDWELVSLPDRCYFLYHFLRPLRLAGLGSALRLKDSADG